MELLDASTDQRVQLRMPWADFVRFLELRGEASTPRITSIDGVLELMSPSKSHEGLKSRIGRLLELWAALEGVAVSPFGSTTLKQRRGQAAAEPDESYVVGRSELGQVPDIAVEVSWSRSGLDKLAVYGRLGVLEVWVCEDERLLVFALKGQRYVRRKKSQFLPGLDLTWLARFVMEPDNAKAVANLVAAYRRN
ncbi:MAG: Uma2 family endonuclease [Myxococcaceae bacterium]|nr:Uma2 family endonuclease [Myxococcaceae bacterium]